MTQELHRIIRATIALFATTYVLFPSAGEAWSDKTHIAIAYIAYHKLSRHTRDRVNEMMVFHPLYLKWTEGAKLGQAGLLAFLYASTWPDCIQDAAKCPGYTEDGTDNGFEPTAAAEEWQNIGFSDHLMHKYWHFVQQPTAASGVAAHEAPAPNLQTQSHLLLDTLNSNAEDDLKCYDLAWVENLMGELHQPLHCTTRFSAEHPSGDKCGREVRLCASPCTDNLRDYWDDLLGTESDLQSGIEQGKSLLHVQSQAADLFEDIDIDRWLKESADLASRSVYTPSVVAEDDTGHAVVLTAQYKNAAVEVAKRQVILAGNRLAQVLNSYLK